MAKLHSYYVLCPLIDQKSFIGVSLDKEPENVIVTLSRNVVNKYRLSDQKQIGGWTSKDHITSKVIYDNQLESYIGVFDETVIKMWTDETENLQKLKKYKFQTPILQVIPRKDQPSLIIFASGNCTSLSYGLENRKTCEGVSVFKNAETIVDIGHYTYNNTDYICYIIENKKGTYEIVCCPLRVELGDLDKSKLTKVKVVNDDSDVYVVGKLISVEEDPVVYVLWSDSTIQSYDLITKTWHTIGTVPWVSTLSSVSLAWMGEKHLIVYGSNFNQEGAIIVAYNISIGVGSCRYPMKLYSDNAKLYCFNNKIVLEASNHIGMLPYVVESSRSLSSLLGSHEIIEDAQIEEAVWLDKPVIGKKMHPQIKKLSSKGLMERSICSEVILPILEKNDMKQLNEVMFDLKDIPESVIVKMLCFVFNSIDVENVNLTDENEVEKICLEKISDEKLLMLNNLFKMPLCDALLIEQLRSDLSLQQALFLLSYITYQLNRELTEDTYLESRLFDWSGMLIDAFYQQFLMMMDEKVTVVLDQLLKTVKTYIGYTMNVNSLLPLFNKLLWTKKVDEAEDSLIYSIEMMTI